MLRYKRWTFEAWYQSECTIMLSLASWLAWYHLETTLWKWKLSSDFISSFNLTTSIHHTSMDILNLELMPCKQTYEMHIQMHHTSSWACSPYLCAQNFKWSLSFVISLPLCQVLPLLSFHHLSTLIYLLSFSPCTNIFVISPPITYIFVSLLLCCLFTIFVHYFSPFVINDHKGLNYR